MLGVFGYDGSWDEARDKGFDEGYETGRDRAFDEVLEMIDLTPMVVTPESRKECSDKMLDFDDNGPLCVMMYMNYLHAQINSMKE